MLDKFVLWWSRTWVMWGLALGLVFFAAPVKTYQVSFEAITSDAFWNALSSDVDVGSTVEEQAKQVVDLVPVDELKELEPMLGETRTSEILGEAKDIRDGIAKEVGTATSQSVNKVVSKSVPRFLMGKDLTGDQLSEDLMLDLRPVRTEIEAWLAKAGRLIVDAITEAVQSNIRTYMAPAISELAAGQEIDGLHARLDGLAASFTMVADTVRSLGEIVNELDSLGLIEDKETANAAKRLTTTLADVAEMGVSATEKGREALTAGTPEGTEPDWALVIDQITHAMITDTVASAKNTSDSVAKDLTQTIVGTGTYTLPQPARWALINQLRVGQAVLAPMVTAGAALNAVLIASMCSLVVLIFLVAGRTRRVAFWMGGIGLMVGAFATAVASAIKETAQAFAEGLGAMGEAVAEAGMVVSKVLTWCWSLMQTVLDIEDTDFEAVGGWGTEDVLASATYGILQNDVIGRLDDWSGSVVQWALIALLLWLILAIAERVARGKPQAEAGTLTAILQQPGGMRIEDPLLLLVPRRGDPVADARPHAAPSRLLARGVWVDLSWILLACLGLFALIGVSVLMIVGPAGGGGIVIGTSAMATCITVVTGLVLIRLIFSTGRTVSGALAGEVLVDDTGASEPWRARSLLAILPWALALTVGFIVVAMTGSAMLGIGLMIALVLLAELGIIVTSGGTKTLGSMCMGRSCVPSAYGITRTKRTSAIIFLTKFGTVWAVIWGLWWILAFGLGLWSLVTGIVGVIFWASARNDHPGKLQPKVTAYLRMAHWLSLDFVGVGLGIATMWLLQDEDARAYFDTSATQAPADAPLAAIEE